MTMNSDLGVCIFSEIIEDSEHPVEHGEGPPVQLRGVVHGHAGHLVPGGRRVGDV